MQVEIHKEDERGNVLTLKEAVSVKWNGRTLTVPAGFESDGVSTPRFFWSSVSPAIDQTTLRAGVVHDYLYRTQPAGWTRADADELFYDFCREDGLSWWKAQKAYWGLRFFGGFAWDANNKRASSSMSKTLLIVTSGCALCLSMTGCAGMTAAGVWASICAGVSAGANVWQASKTSSSGETSAAEERSDAASAKASDAPPSEPQTSSSGETSAAVQPTVVDTK